MSKKMRKEIEQEMMKFIHQGRMNGISGEEIQEIMDIALSLWSNYQLIDENLKGKDGRRK